jgi:zinc/manganese transport system permease protein
MSDLFLWLTEPMSQRFMARALVVTVLLGISGGLVGSVLVLRRLSLVADSFGHALLPGIAIAYLVAGPSLVALFLGGLTAGLITAAASALLTRLTRLKEDASFGALFVCLFAVGAAILSRVAAPADLTHYLFGNILGLGAADARLVALVTTITLVAVALGYRSLLLECFDRGFHRSAGGASATTHVVILLIAVLNLVAALQAVGVVLALGLFILPAVTAALWCDRFATQLLTAATVGAVGSTIGLFVSYHANLPSGACMVGSLGVIFLLSALAGQHGMLARLVRPPRHLTEDGHGDCALPPR